MSAPSGALVGFSPSSLKAMRWASVAAAHRAGGAADPSRDPVRGGDVLVGVLLSHPDADGEARVLLTHFGLTARDVLPSGYPTITAEDLRRLASQASGEVAATTGESETIVGAARSLGGEDVHLYHLLGALLVVESELTAGWETALAGVGSALTSVRDSFQRWLRTYDGSGVAGQYLREWLAEENRLRPIDMPGYASDSIDARSDLIGIGVEADSLAYLIASRDVRPPLAIGLFGDWGSGKSFLMRSVQHRIRALGERVATAPQRTVPVWQNIRQIEFNAWEYVQGNLWAGLLERIFRELGKPPAAGIVETRTAPVQRERNAQDDVARAAETELNELRVKRNTLQEQLEAAEKAARKEREAADKARTGHAGMARTHAIEALGEVWEKERVSIVGEDATAMVDALREARDEVRRGRALLGGRYWTPLRITLVSLGFLVIPLVAFLLAVLNAPPVVAVLGGLAPLVPLVTTTARTGTQWTGKVLARIEAAEAEVRSSSAVRVEEADQRVDDARRELNDADQLRADTEARMHKAIARRKELDEALTGLTPGRILVEFADERSSDYRRRLGLLATVRRDLEQLRDQVVSNNDAAVAETADAMASDMPNRIVLYIDDLYRCPPEKVVEVLEAVHLLLAFELFVVVVAVDSRWLASALTDQLVALRHTDPDAENPTPQNYLEKIFQLPFWVQPLPEPARVQLLSGLLTPSVRSQEPAADTSAAGLRLDEQEEELLAAMLGPADAALRLETSPLALTRDDLRFVESLAPLLGDTPRRIKRFVNTAQLLLAMPPTLSPEPTSPRRREIVCLLAAVAEGLPTVAGRMFAAVRARPTTTFLGACVEWGSESEVAPLKEWLEQRPEWAALTLAGLDVRLDMVDRLTFSPPRLPASRAHLPVS